MGPGCSLASGVGDSRMMGQSGPHPAQELQGAPQPLGAKDPRKAQPLRTTGAETAISQRSKLRPRQGDSPVPAPLPRALAPGPLMIPAHLRPHSPTRSPLLPVRPALSRPGPDPLRVTLTPKKLKTGIGSTVILSCAPMGSPEYTIRWYRNTEPVLPDEAISIRGLSNETLLIASAQKSHSGAYQCFATRKAQTAQDFAVVVLEGERAARSEGGFGTPMPCREVPGPRRPPAPGWEVWGGSLCTPGRCCLS